MKTAMLLLITLPVLAQEKSAETMRVKCVARAQKVYLEQRAPGITWQSHYSSRSGRCLVAILTTYSNTRGAGVSFARYHWELMDASNGSQLAASQWDGPPDLVFCRIEGVQSDCAKARVYIQEQLRE